MRTVAGALIALPVSLADARRRPLDGGVPDEHGLYAWWLAGDELPYLPTSTHPADDELRLLYVGTAPKRATSKGTLRSRVLKQHSGSSLSSSTLRRALTALLWQEYGWTPMLTEAGKWTMPEQHRLVLRAWMNRNLRVSWVHLGEPWKVEPDVVDSLSPPLNLAGNVEHPFYETLFDARRMFERVAKANAQT